MSENRSYFLTYLLNLLTYLLWWGGNKNLSGGGGGGMSKFLAGGGGTPPIPPVGVLPTGFFYTMRKLRVHRIHVPKWPSYFCLFVQCS